MNKVVSWLKKRWKWLTGAVIALGGLFLALARKKPPKVVQYKPREQIRKEEQDAINKIENDAHDNHREWDAWMSSHWTEDGKDGSSD